jgi:hypothetical protein
MLFSDGLHEQNSIGKLQTLGRIVDGFAMVPQSDLITLQGASMQQ